jgi:hypothetical protein
MLAVSIGFVSGGLLLLLIGVLVRRGVTWLIAGYDPSQVRDEKGLARWAGSCFIVMGTIATLAGVLVGVLPPEFAFIPGILFFVAATGGALAVVIGSQRFVK